MKGANNTYFGNIKESISSLSKGLKLTFKHLWEARESRVPVGIDHEDYFKQETGVITLQYPFETLPVPDNGRYRLHNEIDDCIVCDKCAKVCPVNCIDIEPVKAVDDLGVTSDGTKKRIHAAKFDIDMAKCCFCGLCTTVCPTECLTMTKAYDFSEFDVKDHNYSFSEMTPLEILESKKALEKANEAKEAAKASQALNQDDSQAEKPKAKFKPRIKGADSVNKDANQGETVKAKPKFKPRVKGTATSESEKEIASDATAKPKPKFKPKVKKDDAAAPEQEASNESSNEVQSKPKPKFRPKVKKKEATEGDQAAGEPATPITSESTAEPKPKFRPKVKKDNIASPENETTDELSNETQSKPKPKFRPKVKKTTVSESDRTTEESGIPTSNEASDKPKPKFRPKIKPKKKKDDGHAENEGTDQE